MNNFSNSIDQLTTMPFTLNEEDLDKSEEMFNKVSQFINCFFFSTRICFIRSSQICQQKQKSSLDESGGTVEWGDEGDLTFQTVIDKRDWPSKQQHHDSNSSDEDEETRDVNEVNDVSDVNDVSMEVDPNDRKYQKTKIIYIYIYIWAIFCSF